MLMRKVPIYGRTAVESVELVIITTTEIMCHSVVSLIKANSFQQEKPTAVEIMMRVLTIGIWKMNVPIGKFMIH